MMIPIGCTASDGWIDNDGRFIRPSAYRWFQELIDRRHLPFILAYDRRDKCFCMVREMKVAATVKIEPGLVLTYGLPQWSSIPFLAREPWGTVATRPSESFFRAYGATPEQFEVDNSAWFNRKMKNIERNIDKQRSKDRREFLKRVPDVVKSVDKDFRVRPSVLVKKPA